MANFPKPIWDQLKNVTVEKIIKALKKDGWKEDVCIGAVQVYYKSKGKRVTIHYHPKKTYGQGMLKKLLDDIGWSVQDMKKLKIIK